MITCPEQEMGSPNSAKTGQSQTQKEFIMSTCYHANSFLHFEDLVALKCSTFRVALGLWSFKVFAYAHNGRNIDPSAQMQR